MRWRDEALILGVRSHGETSAIAEVFTRGHGRWRALVRGGRSRRMRPVLQTGNLVSAAWGARLEDHLGAFSLEPVRLSAGALMDDIFALSGLAVLSAGLHLLPEREAHPHLFEAARLVTEHLADPGVWPAMLARLELRLLADLGFGLDLSACALTGESADLAWVSPRTGRAAARGAGEPWREKLLPLPAFLRGEAGPAPGTEDVLAALELTGHFLRQRIYAPRGLRFPAERDWIIERLRRRAQS